MSWFYLILAIVFETIGTTALKLSNGFSVLLPSIATVTSYILSFFFLSYTLKTLDVSIAYAIWGACGTLLICTIGIVIFNEHLSVMKVISILFIILGTIGLRLAN